MTCFHGGAFWDQIGADFCHLERRHAVINADVLDAWFPPAPSVVQALRQNADWTIRTSPPNQAEGLIDALATHLQVNHENLMVGAGSTSLMYQAFRQWLSPDSRVLLIDPTYGEYAHLADLCGAQVETIHLSHPFRLDLEAWADRVSQGRYDLVVLVNPNNPTGQAFSEIEIEAVLNRIPETTKVWVDEAYAAYVPGISLRVLRPNLYVLRSMSKAYALSGLRVAYLLGPSDGMADLRRWSAPWSVSLPAQRAAILALAESKYYEDRYRETDRLREHLTQLFPSEIWSAGAANWLLMRLPQGQSAARMTAELAGKGIYIRNAGVTAPALGDGYVRVAVKPPPEMRRLVSALTPFLVG